MVRAKLKSRYEVRVGQQLADPVLCHLDSKMRKVSTAVWKGLCVRPGHSCWELGEEMG